jgi:dephospho-CoA kinase
VTRMMLVALTGSLAMGKSETARMFAELGCPVFDADLEVHRLYAAGGAAVPAVAALFPAALLDGAIDRARLSALLLADPAALPQLESIVHPLVRDAEARFIEAASAVEQPFVILDIPLLFETGRDSDMDRIVVVSAPAEIQRQRALARPGMTEAKLARLLARQTSDADKRARADFIVETGRGLEDAFDQVRRIVSRLREEADRDSTGADARDRP